MVSPKVEWMVKEKVVFNVDTGRIDTMQFLCLNQIDAYNYEMGNVDIVDQMHLNYLMDHWLRNRKWWWSILFWVFGVILSNSYILYTKNCDKEEVEKKNCHTHSKFLREACTYWMKPSYVKKKERQQSIVPMVCFPHQCQLFQVILLVHQRTHVRQKMRSSTRQMIAWVTTVNSIADYMIQNLTLA